MVGREFSLALVTAARRDPVARLLPAIDEAVGHGLVDRIGRDYRFVQVFTRDAVEATLTTAELLALHRAVAEALQELFADDLSEHLADIARHWARLAPYGEASAARAWAVRAADEAVRRLAYEEGVRLYRTALALDERLTTVERYHVLVALGRAAYFAGDPVGCADAAVAAMDLARRAASPELMGQAALVVEATPDLRGLAKQLCDDALAALGDDGRRGATGPAARPTRSSRAVRRRPAPHRAAHRGRAGSRARAAATTGRSGRRYTPGRRPAPVRPVRPSGWRLLRSASRTGPCAHRRRRAGGRGRGASGFAAEARYHLAAALLARDARGDRERAGVVGRDAARLVQALGMSAYADRAAALVARLDRARPPGLGEREAEVALPRGAGPDQPPDRRAAGHLRTHRREPRPAHPRHARVRHPQPDRRVERPHRA